MNYLKCNNQIQMSKRLSDCHREKRLKGVAAKVLIRERKLSLKLEAGLPWWLRW